MRTRDLIAYMALLACAIFVCSVSYMWLVNGPFRFNHWTWGEVIAGGIFLVLATERLISWIAYHIKHRKEPL